MGRCYIGYTPQNCWAATQINVEQKWKEYYEKYDLLEYTLGAVNYFNTLNKIPKDEIPEYEKFYFIFPREYLGVPYLILRQRPGVTPPPLPQKKIL